MINIGYNDENGVNVFLFVCQLLTQAWNLNADEYRENFLPQQLDV